MTTILSASPYPGYLYAYPHKSAYRPFTQRPTLAELWSTEDISSVFLYVHIPFCEMRCGFCNLFTRTGAAEDLVHRYLRQLAAEADVVHEAIGAPRVAMVAVGGGTPTYLDPDQLMHLRRIIERFAGEPASLALETSPATATPDRLAVLDEWGVQRISMGVQSFLDDEARAAGRPQRRSDVDAALAAIRSTSIPTLNLDLIYGIDGQSAQSWQYSLSEAMAVGPEEIYLYPLYVRPLTGLALRNKQVDTDSAWDRVRLAQYWQARDYLVERGYRQLSMRHFRKESAPTEMTEYSCQDDGMIGLGCGARSYTRSVHYSFDYAVGVKAVRAIIDDYTSADPERFRAAETGIRLNIDEQRRRWLIKSLLRVEGVDVTQYRERFGSSLYSDFRQLELFADHGWLEDDGAVVRLTAHGLARSDQIGSHLISPEIRAAMSTHDIQ